MKKTENNRVLVIQAISTTRDLIRDMTKRGYKPIILLQHLDGPFQELVDKQRKLLGNKYPIYKADKDYKKTLATAKKIDPAFIVYTSEFTVDLASRLSTDLKVPGNNYKYVQNFISKHAMHKALKEYGIRYIKSELAHSKEEIIKIFHKFGDKPVVIKPPRCFASICVGYCNTLQDVKEFVEKNYGSYNELTKKPNTTFLIQEWIHGEEYIINTMNVKGKTKIVWVGKYALKKINSQLLYVNYESISRQEVDYIGINELLQYAMDVNKALHIDNGPVHGEFFIDENGPVLCEVNCRLMGGPMDERFIGPQFGSSESSQFVDSLVFAKDKDARLAIRTQPYCKGVISIFYSVDDNILVSLPFKEIFKHIPTAFREQCDDTIKNKVIHKGVNFDTPVGRCYLLGNDAEQVKRDRDLLEVLKSKYFFMLYECKNEPKLMEHKPKGVTAKQFINDHYKFGTILYLTDKNEDYDYVTRTNLAKVEKDLRLYNYGVINFKKKPKINREKLVGKLFAFFDKINVGGQIFIPNESATVFPYGNRGYEILLKLAGFELQFPTDDYRGLFAKKVKTRLI